MGNAYKVGLQVQATRELRPRCQELRAKATLACKKLQAVLTRPLFWRRRYSGHDTGECDASFGLCHLQLNSFKVTLNSVAGLTSLYNQVCTNITPQGRKETTISTLEGQPYPSNPLSGD
jgi:hypothetical protein